MRPDDMEEMRLQPVFAGARAEHVDAMLRVSFLQRFPAHVELVREGDSADFLHVVVDGQVEIFASYRDRETTVSVLGSGHSFIVAAVILDRLYLKSARALVPSRVLLIPASAVRRYFTEDPAFARTLATEMALAYRSLVKELKNQKLRSGLERLANWLLVRHAETGSTGQFELPFEKRVLASRLGMAPEVLSRSFSALAPFKVVVNGRVIRVQDVQALRQLAQPTQMIDDPEV